MAEVSAGPAPAPDRNASAGAISKASTLVAFGLALLLVAGLGWATARITVEYYDGYEYLVTGSALNGPARYFQPKHLLLSTGLAAWERLGGALGIPSTLPWFHSGMLIANLAAALLLALLVRKAVPGVPLAAAFLLVAANRLFAHYAPFALGDLLLVGVIAGWGLVARSTTIETGRGLIARILVVALCLLARPQIVLIPAAGLALEAWEGGSRRAVRALLVLATAALLHLLGAAAFSAAALDLPLPRGLDAYLDFLAAFGREVLFFPSSPWWAPLLHFVMAFSPLSAALVLFGVEQSIRGGAVPARLKRDPDRALYFGSVLYILFLLFGLTAADARYLAPVWPAAVLLAARGWRALDVRSNTLGAGVLAMLLLLAGIEIAKFRDPFYASDLHARVSREVDAWAQGRAVVFVTPMAALFPDDHAFSRYDNSWAIYAWNRAAHAFHAGVTPMDLAFIPGFDERGYPWPNGIDRWLGPDAVAVVPAAMAHREINLPDRMPTIHLFRSAAAPDTPGGRFLIETAHVDPEAWVR